MGDFSQEKRARFVLFLGLGMLAVFMFFHEMISDTLGYEGEWLIEGGGLHTLAGALILLGAWKWLNVHEERRNGDDR